jgi:hypothetical protein
MRESERARGTVRSRRGRQLAKKSGRGREGEGGRERERFLISSKNKKASKVS